MNQDAIRQAVAEVKAGMSAETPKGATVNANEDIGAWLESHRVELTGHSLNDIIGVAGVARARRELEGLIERLREPEKTVAMGAELPRGLLLYGPPGCGKTLFARTLAASAALPFYELSAPEIMDPDRLRALGRHLASMGSVAIYLDEADAIGTSRSHPFRADAESRKALLTLLSVMDGLLDAGQVLWIAATNVNPSELDSALLRSGRLGTLSIKLDKPSLPDRQALLEAHLRRRRTEGAIDTKRIAELTHSYSQAALIGTLDDAAGLALLDGASAISERHVREALRRDGQVSTNSTRLTPRQRQRAAIHESGHVVAICELLGADDLLVVKIGGHEDGTGGYTRAGRHADDDEDESDAPEPVPGEDVSISAADRNMEDVWASVCIALAGRQAEASLCDGTSSGAWEDMKRATSDARTAILSGGDEAYNLVHTSPFDPHGEGAGSVDQMNDLYAQVRHRIGEQRERARWIIERHADRIRTFAARLNETGELAGGELQEALREAGLLDLDEENNEADASSAPEAADEATESVVDRSTRRPTDNGTRAIANGRTAGASK